MHLTVGKILLFGFSAVLILMLISAFLLSGTDQFRENFEAKRAVNQASIEKISSATSLFTPSQRQYWATFSQLRTEFTPLPTITAGQVFDNSRSKAAELTAMLSR